MAVHAGRQPWVASPVAGVERRMLDRIGNEVARATTIVRFAPGSKFSPHTHGGGEEYLVLEGTFQDNYGNFPSGAYVRNPPTTSHTPSSSEGCTIFVKLWQFDPDDRNQVCVDTKSGSVTQGYGISGNAQPTAFVDDDSRPGISVMHLHADDNELVMMHRWAPGAEIEFPSPAGIELLVVKGSFEEGGEQFEEQSWLRLPKGSRLSAVAGPAGAQVWMKRGHLAQDITGPNNLAHAA